MDKEGRINAYLNLCRRAPYGFLGPTHWHRELDGQMREYLALDCASYKRTQPMEVCLSDLLKHPEG